MLIILLLAIDLHDISQPNCHLPKTGLTNSHNLVQKKLYITILISINKKLHQNFWKSEKYEHISDNLLFYHLTNLFLRYGISMS